MAYYFIALQIFKKGAAYLTDWLRKQKESGKVQNIGLSIYESSDLDGLDLLFE